MKKLLFLVWILYIIASIFFIKLFLLDKKIEQWSIEDSIAIIIPEEKLISYKTNPGWIFEENKEYWIWAWFVISTDWKIQTVNHIVENENIKYKVILNNIEYDSEVISRDKENDLAILKINTTSPLTPLLVGEGDINENIITYWIDIKNLSIISNTWTILNKKSKLENMSNLLEISNILKPGFSGWPIINSEWKVIWINYAVSEWKSYWITLP